jgi:hypothetical protein
MPCGGKCVSSALAPASNAPTTVSRDTRVPETLDHAVRPGLKGRQLRLKRLHFRENSAAGVRVRAAWDHSRDMLATSARLVLP